MAPRSLQSMMMARTMSFRDLFSLENIDCDERACCTGEGGRLPATGTSASVLIKGTNQKVPFRIASALSVKCLNWPLASRSHNPVSSAKALLVTG